MSLTSSHSCRQHHGENGEHEEELHFEQTSTANKTENSKACETSSENLTTGRDLHRTAYKNTKCFK